MACVICRARLTNGAERQWLNMRKTMALLVDEDKLKNLLDDFYQKAYFHGQMGVVPLGLDYLLNLFIEECKKTSPAP
jgi:hypothetical protein